MKYFIDGMFIGALVITLWTYFSCYVTGGHHWLTGGRGWLDGDEFIDNRWRACKRCGKWEDRH